MPPSSSRTAPALKRIYRLLELYLTGIEASFAEKRTNRAYEGEARMLNALARTLEKLAKLEQAFASQTSSAARRAKERQSLHEEIERRIARLMAEDETESVPKKP